MKKILFVVIFSYFLVLFQTSFLVHFRFLEFLPNLVLVLVIILSIFEEKISWGFLPQNPGIWTAFWGGFFLDIFSSDFIGTQIIILLAVSLFTKVLAEKILRLPKKT